MTIDLSSPGFRLSPQQRQIWVSQQAYPDQSFRVVGAFSVAGHLDSERLRQSVALIVESHEILRTSFVRPAGIKTPFQVISEETSFFWRVVDLKQLDEAQHLAQIEVLFTAECNERFLFDGGPVVRAQFVETAEFAGVLLLSLPALCADSQTLLNIAEEMFGAGLPADEIAQYADFAEWENQLLESDDEHALARKAYWKNKQNAPDSHPALPHESSYANEQAPEYGLLTVKLDSELVKKLDALERETETSVQDLLFVMWQSLIARLSGQRELTIYKRYDARQDQDLRGALGPFEQYVPIRGVVESDLFEHQLRLAGDELKQATDAFVYAGPLDEALVSGKAIAFEFTDSVWSSSFSLLAENGSLKAELKTSGAITVSLAKQFVFSNPFKLKLSCTRSNDQLTLQLQYDRRILRRENGERFLDYLQTVIQAVATATPAVRSHLKLDAIDILSESERHALLIQANDTATEYAREKCVHEFFEEQAGRTPTAVAVVCGDQQLSYEELNSRANQVAHLLISTGVKPNTCVGMCLTRSVDSIVALLGIIKTGAAYVPLNPDHPLARLQAQLKKSQATVCLTNSNNLAESLEASVETIDFDKDAELIGKQSRANTTIPVSSEALVYAIYTSGSTGTPKAVAVRHRNLVNYAQFILNRLQIEEPLHFATVSTISADLGNTCIFPALFSGGCLHLVSHDVSLESRSFSNYLSRHRIAVLKIAPSHLQALLSDGEQTVLPSRYLILGGEAFPRQLLDLIRATPHTCQIINHYGPTETTVGSLIFAASTQELSDLARTVPIGRPIANTSAYILDKYMRVCPSGVAGELYLGGAGVAAGYLNDADQTVARFIPDPFSSDAGGRLYRTGDWARILPDGNVEFLGRIDSQVKVRGYRIELGEIETALNEHPLVRQAVVILRRDAGRERLVAYVMGPRLRAANAAELTEFLKQQLPDYMLPAAIVVMRAFPTTANGKVDRDALPAEDSLTAHKVVVAPQTVTERELARVWSELLKLEELSVHDDFFDLGGHSLLATQLVSRIRKTFNKDIPLRSIFDAPTITRLAGVIEHVTDNDQLDSQTEPEIRRETPRASFAQERLWFLQQLEPESAAYNVPRAIRILGNLNLEVLKRSLNEIVTRHEPLRTHFALVDGSLRQMVEQSVLIELPLIDLANLPLDESAVRTTETMKHEAVRAFDLGAGPVLRARILRLSAAEHLLLVTMHHIVSDAWSAGIFFQELTALYKEFSQHKESLLTPLKFQYGDYAEWQRDWLQGEVLETQLGYWKNKLSESPAVLNIPTDRPRPAQTDRGATCTFSISESLTDQLRDLSLANGATVFMTLLATFSVLLYRYSGEDDIVIGTPIAGRNRAEVEGLIGFFINTLPLRIDIGGNPTFRNLLARVKQTALEGYEHQDLPFEKLVEELKPERSNGMPFFQVLFQYQHAPRSFVALDGLTFMGEAVEHETSKVDLSLGAYERDGALKFQIEYSTDLFERKTIETMISRFTILLRSIVSDPDRRVGQLAITSEAERRRTLVDWNNTQHYFGDFRDLQERFERQVEQHPDDHALMYRGQQMTFGELNVRANKLAHHLKNIGVGSEMPVAVLLERSADMIVALLGVLKAGSTWVPLEVSYPKERINYVLQDSGARVVLTHDKYQTLLPTADHRVLLDTGSKEFEHESTANPPLTATADTAAYVIYTSGSTGRPKGVVGLHGATVNRLEWMYRRYPFASGEICCQKTSLSFVDSIWEIFGPLLAGVPLIIFPDYVVKDVDRFIEELNEAKVTRIVLVPSLLRAMLQSGIAQRLPRLKSWTCSGEALPLDLAKNLKQQLPDAALLNLYGSAEVAADVTYYNVNETERTEIPLGYPIANTQVYILDCNLEPVPLGVTGEIYVGGDGLARGYLDRPDLTAQKFVPHPFADNPGRRLYRTGDLGRFREDGAIEYRGRTDHQVKIRGSRVELGEIESALAAHPEIRAAIVLAKDDASGDKRLIAYVISSSKTLSTRDVRNFLSRELPEFMIPASVVVLEDFPKTASGKIDRLSLPSPADLREGHAAPRNLTEEIVAGVLAEVMKLDEISINDDFFELGGHSLLIPQVTARLNELFAVNLPLRTFFDSSRVSELAATVANLRSANHPVSEARLVPVSHDGKHAVTFAQESLWAIEQINPGTGAYNIPRAMRLKGSLETEALERSINVIVSRHEVLRTVFRSDDGRPFASVNPDCHVDLKTYDLGDLDQTVRQRVSEECRRPFNLATGPLLRVALLRLNENDHVLVVTMHHIISDGWSMGVFFDELVACYNDLVTDTQPQLATIPIQFADFAAWQSNSLRGDNLEHSLAYWQQQLSDAPEITDLPADRARPNIRSFQGSCYLFEIPNALATTLKELAKAERVTFFMTLLGAFQTLLWTYSKHNCVVVGSPSAGRRPGTENLIGYFVNTLALKTSFAGDPTFRDVMHRVAETTVGALAHEHVPFAKIVERLQKERTLSHNPIFQVWFVLQAGHGAAERRDFAGLTVEPYPLETEVTRHELQLTLWESQSALKAAFTYNTDILEQQTVSLMAEEFSLLLAKVVEQPEIRCGELRRVLEQEREAHRNMKEDATRPLTTARRKVITMSPENLVQESAIARGAIQLRPAVEGLSLLQWLQSNRQLVLDNLQTSGAVLFRDFNLLTIPNFEQLLTSISGELLDYSYRSTPRERVNGKIYTSTSYPAHQTIALHNEMSYSRKWPSIIGFFCVEPATEGGETPIADSRKVFEQIDPVVREEFIRKQVMYVRNYDDALDLPWREVFQTDNKAEVEDYCAKAGMRVEWHGDKHLRTSQVCQAVTKHPVTGEFVWFNQAHLFHISSLDAELRSSLKSGPDGHEPRNAFFGDGSEISEAALDHIRSVYDNEKVAFAWQRGDILILDNILKAHGRNPYRGPRQIVVGMGHLTEN